MSALNVGIVGLRHQHPKSYLPLLRMIEGVEVAAVAERDEKTLAAFEAEQGIKGVRDWKEMLRREDIQAVIVFLPHAEMPDCAVAAAEAGKHVLIEKPIAADVDGARRILEAERTHRVKMSVSYCWRLHPVVARLRELLETGALGQVRALEGRLSAGGPARYIADNSAWMLTQFHNGGPMWNLGVHWIDLFLWLLKDEVTEVVGMLNRFSGGVEREIEDNCFALMHFAGGAVATLDISYSVPPVYPLGRDLFVAVRGSRGDIAWSPAWGKAEDSLFVVSDTDAFKDRPVMTETIASRPISGYGGEAGLLLLEAFFRAIREDTEVPVSILDAVRVLEIAEAIYDSADCSRTVAVKASR